MKKPTVPSWCLAGLFALAASCAAGSNDTTGDPGTLPGGDAGGASVGTGDADAGGGYAVSYDAGGGTDPGGDSGSGSESPGNGDEAGSSGEDAGSGAHVTGQDAGSDAGIDAGFDSGKIDAGVDDGGTDAGVDSGGGTDAGADSGGGTDAGGVVPATCAQSSEGYGCCVGKHLYYCNLLSSVVEQTCTGSKVCGWSASEGYYDCVPPPSEPDPSGTYPLACQ